MNGVDRADVNGGVAAADAGAFPNPDLAVPILTILPILFPPPFPSCFS